MAVISKNNFSEWLGTYANIKPYSIRRYSNAIDTISSELEHYGLEKIDLYDLTDTKFIHTIMGNDSFKKKNAKGNRMYSAALNHLKKYVEYNNDSRLQAEQFKEEHEFEKYLAANLSGISKGDIEDKPRAKPSHRSVSNRKVWSRSPKYASEALADADYLCEFDSQHKHFVSKFNGKNYVEAHHLIPMEYQDQFENSLDIHANIVSLCLECHKKIHFGLFKDIREILQKLFDKRNGRLKASGIEMDISQLHSYYQN